MKNIICGRGILIILMHLILFSTVISAENTSKNIKEKPKKKIVFIKDDNSEFFNGFTKYIQGEFEKNGWTKENSEFIVLSTEGRLAKARENVEEVKKIKPDVVYINGTYFDDRITPLYGTGIPVVVIAGVDLPRDSKGGYAYLDKNRKPKSNITGVYGFTENFQMNALKFLSKIAPLNGKKVVALAQPGWFENDFVNACKKLKLDLKFIKLYKYYEEFQEDFEKYNNDPEVGWLLVDGPITRKDGKEWTRKDTFLWEHSNIKKPNIAFFQNNVEQGALCGFAVDPMGYVNPSLELVYQILKGKKPKEVKPVYPDKYYIYLNQKAAGQIGIQFPPEIVSGAYRIYTDYDGHYLGEK